jgi:LCP family protein required for cell wall assembly
MTRFGGIAGRYKDQMADSPPEYKVYKTRKNPLSGLGSRGLEGLRKRPKGPKEPREKREITPGRVLKWVALAAAAWLLFALVLFLISAQVSGGLSPRSERALSGNSSLLLGSTVLIIGTDTRAGDSIDKSQTGPARADTLMLLHTSIAGMRRLSIPRDAEADIPGHDRQKINAAYALGGRPLTVETIEGYMGNGLKINHIMEIDFKGFPKFIDSIGGVSVTAKRRVCSPPFDNFWKGLRFKKGENDLTGAKALGWARVRKNECAPQENDLDRAERQQELLSGVRGQLVSPATFLRAPWVAWNAPKAFKTDLHGPGLLALGLDATVGGTGESKVLKPSCLDCGAGGSLRIPKPERADAVDWLNDGD